MYDIIKELNETIKSRKGKAEENSYTAYLFDKGIDKILKKCGEECAEMIIAAKNGNKEELVGEICDLIYHMIVMQNACGVNIEDIEQELSKRNLKTGNLKEFKTVDKNT